MLSDSRSILAMRSSGFPAVFPWLPGRCEGHKHGRGFIHRQRVAITILQRHVPNHAPIAATNKRGTRIKGMGMTEQQDRLAQEREEIAARVANFKATQEKFEREREEYFVTTLENARSGFDGRPHWSWNDI
jgi:hypothetical protein